MQKGKKQLKREEELERRNEKRREGKINTCKIAKIIVRQLNSFYEFIERTPLVLTWFDQFCMPVSVNVSNYFEDSNMLYNNHC